MKLALAVGLCLACAGAYAQKADGKRIDQIWKVAEDRFVRQNEVWFHDGEFPRNVQLLKFHFSINPHDYELATNLGWMLENVEQYDEAIAVYIQYRLENPADVNAPFPEASFYFRKKLYAKVPPLLEPTIKKKPHPNSYRTLAHSYERLNLLTDAKRTWEALIAKYGADDVAKNNLNRVLKKLKEGSSKKS